MTWWVWLVAGWVGLTIGFVLGGWWAGRHRDEMDHTITVLSAKLAAAQRDPAHRRCRRIEQALSDHLDFLEDQLGDGRQVVAEAERITREAGP